MSNVSKTKFESRFLISLIFENLIYKLNIGNFIKRTQLFNFIETSLCKFKVLSRDGVFEPLLYTFSEDDNPRSIFFLRRYYNFTFVAIKVFPAKTKVLRSIITFDKLSINYIARYNLFQWIFFLTLDQFFIINIKNVINIIDKKI